MSVARFVLVSAAIIGGSVALAKAPQTREKLKKSVANKLRNLSVMLDPVVEQSEEEEDAAESEHPHSAYPRSAYAPVPHQPMWEPPADDSVDTEDLISQMYRIVKENPPSIGFS